MCLSTCSNIVSVCLCVCHRYIDASREPESQERMIEFLVTDGRFNDSATITLQIQPRDDNPTVVME